MKRIILDTSVYGELVKDPPLVSRLLKLKGEFVYYGNSIIRGELRDTPKSVRLGSQKLKLLLLQVYDSLITKENHSLELTSLIELLAEEYFRDYRQLKGGYSKKDIFTDFLIVACASLHTLDILVSHDEKSMLGEKSIKAYKAVNKKFQLNNPSFLTFQDFKKEVQTSV